MKTFKIFNTVMPSEVNNVCDVVNNVILYVKEYLGVLCEDNIFELKVILNELILNAIKHGNKGDRSKQVSIEAGIVQNSYIYLIIQDQGEGYNYNCTLNTDKCFDSLMDICDMKETGRGITIVKSLCDRIKYNTRGNKVVVLKRLCK